MTSIARLCLFMRQSAHPKCTSFAPSVLARPRKFASQCAHRKLLRCRAKLLGVCFLLLLLQTDKLWTSPFVSPALFHPALQFLLLTLPITAAQTWLLWPATWPRKFHSLVCKCFLAAATCVVLNTVMVTLRSSAPLPVLRWPLFASCAWLFVASAELATGGSLGNWLLPSLFRPGGLLAQDRMAPVPLSLLLWLACSVVPALAKVANSNSADFEP